MQLIESDSVGATSRIEPSAWVQHGAVIGEGCAVSSDAVIGGSARIGDRVVVGFGTSILGSVLVAEDVIIAERVMFAEASQREPSAAGPTRVGRAVVIEADVTVLAGVRIGDYAIIGAGCVVARDVPSHAALSGSSARIVNDVDTPSAAVDDSLLTESERIGSISTRVEGVRLATLPAVEDFRGRLSFGEVGRDIPFEVKRYFIVFGVPSEEARGEHAHRDLHQFLLCVNGSCCVVADDGKNRESFILSSPCRGLYLPPKTWSVQDKFTPDAILLVLASNYYEATDYIRDYDEFLRYRER